MAMKGSSVACGRGTKHLNNWHHNDDFGTERRPRRYLQGDEAAKGMDRPRPRGYRRPAPAHHAWTALAAGELPRLRWHLRLRIPARRQGCDRLFSLCGHWPDGVVLPDGGHLVERVALQARGELHRRHD